MAKRRVKVGIGRLTDALDRFEQTWRDARKGKAITRDFRETILARAQRDGRYREALFTEAINAYLTGDTALRLGLYFNVSPELWMGLQSDYDLRVAQRNVPPKIRQNIRRRVA